jgi:hypothetical protein
VTDNTILLFITFQCCFLNIMNLQNKTEYKLLYFGNIFYHKISNQVLHGMSPSLKNQVQTLYRPGLNTDKWGNFSHKTVTINATE